jgi:polyisoprenoid-binding protein YceI
MPKIIIAVLAALVLAGGSYAAYRGAADGPDAAAPKQEPAATADDAHSAHGFALVDGSYVATTADTSVTWEDAVAGAKDLGKITLTNAELVVKDGKVVAVDAALDVSAAVANASLALAAQGQADLSKALAPALAEAKKYPSATFALTGIEARGGEGEYTVRGTLSLKGTKPMEYPVSFPASIGMHDGVLVVDSRNAVNADQTLRVLVAFKRALR